MNLIKTSFWSAIYTSSKILAGLVTTKIMATYIGPTGIAFLGNFNNLTGIFTVFANGAIDSGITKYISEFDSEDEKESVVSHALKISLVSSLTIGIIVLVFHNALAMYAFGDLKFSYAFVIFGFTIVFFGLNITISAILNGYRNIRYMIIIGMIGSVISVILAFIITIRFGLMGALTNSAIAQVCIFIINIQFVKRLKLFSFRILRMPIDKVLLWKLFKYATMSLVTVLVVPTSTLIIRTYIINHYSPNEAGYVQGVWSVSAAYLMVITTTLSIYYLPTLSGIKDEIAIRKEILKGYKLLLPVAILGGIVIYLSRDLIIYMLYTPEFIPMKKYFTFQIIGDSLKIASWILGYLMVAKAMTRYYIVTEIIFSGLYVVLSFVFMYFFGTVGVTYSYSLNYCVFLIYLLIVFRKLLFKKKDI